MKAEEEYKRDLILAFLRSLLYNRRRLIIVPGLMTALVLLLFQKKMRVQISQRVRKPYFPGYQSKFLSWQMG